ncbi:unnamed protein product [Symbiodinium necroappetens]|uniref:Uncharacterized protein n=1 Tax=Symbiodinium necroappetens TaxID=1628268 RepID=A0A812KU19_9DINO|nr:unnamed protein product [Symbiodinium necroappetens]
MVSACGCCDGQHSVAVEVIETQQAYPAKSLDDGSEGHDGLPCATKSTAPRSLTKEVRLEKLQQLEVDTELVRGVPLQVTLRNFGKMWRVSPLSLSEEARNTLYRKSVHIDSFDVFLSHTWHTKGRWKVLSLLLQSGLRLALLAWAACVAVMFVLSSNCLLPLPFEFISRFGDGAKLSCGPWCLLGSFIGHGAGLMLAPYAPTFCSQAPMCFLDVASINQTDKELMERGVYGIGGFLCKSKELRVLWSCPYFTRLWCVFEVAAFRTANPTGRLAFRPLFVEVGSFMCVAGAYFSCFLYMFSIPLGSVVAPLASYAIALAPVYVLMHQLRQNSAVKYQLLHDLKRFDLAAVQSHSDFDRQFVFTAIKAWYGSTEAFTQFVQGPLREELLESGQSTIPLKYILLPLGVMASLSLDWVVALLCAHVSADSAVDGTVLVKSWGQKKRVCFSSL